VRAFADAAAAIGVPAMRFDYAGTGDSADMDPEADQLDAWSGDIVAAIEELQRRTGVDRVCLLGFRLGGMLAVQTAARCKAVSALIVISPVIRGKKYLRELRTTSLASILGVAEAKPADIGTNDASSSSDAALEVAGFSLSAASRAALSQGLIATAKVHAKRATAELDRYVTEGRDIVVVEPSSLAMFRRDMKHLIDKNERFERFRSRALDPVEYVIKVLEKTGRTPADVFDASHSPVGTKIFFHAHCQQKTIGADAPIERLLREIGFDVLTTQVECCGMAGSFGYKTDYYDLSIAVGADLFNQIIQQERSTGQRTLVASGTSCSEQLHAGFERHVIHPIELLASILKK